MRALRWSIVVALGCATAPPPVVEEEPEQPRTKMYFAGDPEKTLARVRTNATAGGCVTIERSSGTLIKCPDADVWFVSDPKGIEITCSGVPTSCSKRTHALLRLESGG